MATTRRTRASGYRERILAAARELAREKPLDRIGLSEVARRAGVSWPTVKRYVGTKEQLRQALMTGQPELRDALPDTRRRLLDAAAQVFARDGYERATLDEIARAAGLTKGAVYWHFEAKHEVFGALLAEHVARQTRDAHDDARAAGEQPARAIEELITLQLARAARDPEWTALLLQCACRRDRGESPARASEALAALPRATAELCRELQAAGVADRSLAPGAAGRLLSAVVYGLMLQWVADPAGVDLRAIAPAAAKLLARGVGGGSR